MSRLVMAKKPVLLMARGLPGSGKSFHGESLAKEGWKVVTKDDIRIELGLSRSNFSKEAEYSVLDRRDHLISEALKVGMNVYSADTNFGRKHEPRLRQLAAQYGAEFEIKVFDTPIEVCIERDSKREGAARVGPDVIWGMAESNLGMKRPQPVVVETKLPQYVDDPILPSCVICDLDGTLCIHNGRGPFDYDKCGTDKVNKPIRDLITRYSLAGFKIIYLSGREDSARALTNKWLWDNECPVGPLYMRKSGDYRKDYLVKGDLFEERVNKRFNVEFVLDDRPQVLNGLWRKIGVTTLQVGDGKEF